MNKQRLINLWKVNRKKRYSNRDIESLVNYITTLQVFMTILVTLATKENHFYFADLLVQAKIKSDLVLDSEDFDVEDALFFEQQVLILMTELEETVKSL